MLLGGIIFVAPVRVFSVHQRYVISLLIHGFLSVNARLLIAFGTAFYAIMKLEINMYHYKTATYIKFQKIASVDLRYCPSI